MSFSAKWVWVQPGLPSLSRSRPPLQSCGTRVPVLVTQENKPGKVAGKVDGAKGPRRRDAEGGARRSQARSLSCPLRSCDLYLLRAARLRARKADSPRRPPVLTCLPWRALQNPGHAWPERWGQGAARRCVTNARRRNSGSVPGLGGRRSPAAQRNSALVAARSPRSRSQTRGRRSRSARRATVFRRPGPWPSEEQHLAPGAAASSQPRLCAFPAHCGPLRCRPPARTRPTCALLVRVKSFMRLPPRASLRPHHLSDRDREGPRRPEPARRGHRVSANPLWVVAALARAPRGERIRIRNPRGPNPPGAAV